MREEARKRSKGGAREYVNSHHQLLSRLLLTSFCSFQPTFADFELFDVVEKNHVLLGNDIFDAFPHITAFYQKIKSRPHIAEYLAGKRLPVFV